MTNRFDHHTHLMQNHSWERRTPRMTRTGDLIDDRPQRGLFLALQRALAGILGNSWREDHSNAIADHMRRKRDRATNQ